MLVLLLVTACGVDDRHLELSYGGSGGMLTTTAGTGGDGPEPPSDGGAAPAMPAPDGLVDGCADLDTDSIADCRTNLLTTPSFAADISGWTARPGAKLAWDEKNALADAPSGSAKLSADSARGSAFQCVPLSGEHTVIAYANAFVQPSGDGETLPSAQLQVSFFQGDDCSGDGDGFFEAPPTTAVGGWAVVQAGGLSGAGTRSTSLSLVGIKAPSAAMIEVYFDNVMLKTHEP